MDVVAILEKLQSLGFVKLHKVSHNYYQVHCPFHSDGQEKKPSCGVLLHEEVRNGHTYPAGWWHCFACGAAKSMEQAVSDILKNHSISQSGLDWLRANIAGFEAQDYEIDRLLTSELSAALSSKYAVDYISSLTNSSVQYVSEEELASYRFTVPYMYERKLTDSIINAYDIGYDGNWVPPGRKKPVPCITFPVRDRSGNTLFICRRSIQGKLYNLPENVNKPVYGIDMIPPGCKSLLICESCINALTAVSWGYPSVALLGTGNPYQIQQLRELGMSEFVLCLDGDDAGKKGELRLKRGLSDVAFLWTIHMPDGKDVNDCTKEEFEQLYAERD